MDPTFDSSFTSPSLQNYCDYTYSFRIRNFYSYQHHLQNSKKFLLPHHLILSLLVLINRARSISHRVLEDLITAVSDPIHSIPGCASAPGLSDACLRSSSTGFEGLFRVKCFAAPARGFLLLFLA